MSTVVDNTSAGSFRNELASRFTAPLIRYFRRRIHDQAQAEDLTQEVLLRVIRAAESQSIVNAESYVFRAAANILNDHRRHARRHPTVNFDEFQESPAAAVPMEFVDERSPERVAVGEATLDQVLRALGELAELTRNVFILFRLENMKQKDIAVLYGISQSTVEKHVVRALLHLAVRCGST